MWKIFTSFLETIEKAQPACYTYSINSEWFCTILIYCSYFNLEGDNWVMEKLLYTGKAKQMWQTDDPEVLRVVYMDQATALNGKKKDHFAGKGAAAKGISDLVFNYLIEHGIATH